MQTISRCSINSWGPVWFLLSVLFFAGCSGNDDGTGNPNEGSAIAFDCSASDMRAAKTTAADMQYFRISAIWNKGNGVYASFMDKQLVERDGDNWVYSPVKYWPGYGTVSFFAYSPATLSGLDLLYIENSSNEASFEYTVSKNYQEQEDFMVASNLDKNGNPIRLYFEHALAGVYFRARSGEAGVSFRIREIKLTGIYSKGILTGIPNEETKTSDWTWYGQSGATSYVVYQKYPFETQGDEYGDVGDLMVLPQGQDQDINVPPIKIEVLYDIVGGAADQIRTYELEKSFTFEKGRKYTLHLTLDTQASSLSQKQYAGMTAKSGLYIASEPTESR
ncbi:fimbrillin family protein [Dysgonomonas sp. 511]|uniref:fimbrillin family protein n=1 Tax=Dysgonomonas sp. 511 TaxID=2302930 RepID=UPI0013D1D296|nr:fimbrillin family protein [Dysgonomonas sp. 511]NDV77917.1 fimbrillin family protein [Dysgonomonas sp. 511]